MKTMNLETTFTINVANDEKGFPILCGNCPYLKQNKSTPRCTLFGKTLLMLTDGRFLRVEDCLNKFTRRADSVEPVTELSPDQNDAFWALEQIHKGELVENEKTLAVKASGGKVMIKNKETGKVYVIKEEIWTSMAAGSDWQVREHEPSVSVSYVNMDWEVTQ